MQEIFTIPDRASSADNSDLKQGVPNGGNTLTPRASIDIQWVTNETKKPVSKVKLYYTKNNGKTWILIKTLDGNLGTTQWTAPPAAASSASKVKVVLLDKSGATLGSDVSDTTFSIHHSSGTILFPCGLTPVTGGWRRIP